MSILVLRMKEPIVPPKSSVTEPNVQVEAITHIEENTIITPNSFKDDQEAINIHTIELVAKSVGNKKKQNISLSIWDLGGQEVFYTLHHLFLTKYAVYLVVHI